MNPRDNAQLERAEHLALQHPDDTEPSAPDLEARLLAQEDRERAKDEEQQEKRL